jgi:N-acyl-D-amino-acid deacylase
VSLGPCVHMPVRTIMTHRSSPSRQSRSLTRRSALQAGGASAAAIALSRRASLAQGTATPVAAGEIPVSGEAVPELADFDQLMTAMMAKWTLPGGQLAIARDDRLLYNRGFGYASVEDGEVVEPDTLFRIASNSKPITAVAVLMLVDAGEIALDTPVFPLLDYEPLPNAPYDGRLDTVTLEHLLVHSGGWNSAAGYDPQYLPWPLVASHTLGEPSPAEAEAIVRLMLTQPLDFDPGTQSAYSNFGFNVLGRVIEKLSGQEYEQFVIDNVLAPSGITTMAIGGTTLEERMPDEVRYYSPPGLAYRPSVYPGDGFVPVGYGSYYLRSMDAHGGWIGSARDMVRFTLAVDGTKGEALLAPETVTAMETTPRPPSAAAGAGNVDEALGLGWNSVASGDGHEWTHAGALEGSNCAWMVRKPDGTTLALVFNSLPEDFGTFFGEIIPGMQQLMGRTDEWPEKDLFG